MIKLLRGVIFLTLFVYPCIFYGMSDEKWIELINKIQLTPEQSYLLIGDYTGNLEIISKDIYSKAQKYIEDEKKQIKLMIYGGLV